MDLHHLQPEPENKNGGTFMKISETGREAFEASIADGSFERTFEEISRRNGDLQAVSTLLRVRVAVANTIYGPDDLVTHLSRKAEKDLLPRIRREK